VGSTVIADAPRTDTFVVGLVVEAPFLGHFAASVEPVLYFQDGEVTADLTLSLKISTESPKSSRTNLKLE
jgi:hypothetical protein